MPGTKTQFQLSLENEVNKVKGVYYPVKAGLLRRALIRQVPCKKLHPNPDDEFCSPEIGPNPEIIANYIQAYRQLRGKTTSPVNLPGSILEPLVVERVHPDGYMILNGHHRWIAAARIGIKKLPVRIVDLTQKKDIQKMISKASSDRRVTLDLDETVFRAKKDPCVEKPLPFPFGNIYREHLRLGIPALFHFLARQGYDIWVYSAQYYSLGYIRAYFRHYRIHVTGIVTGTSRKAPKESNTLTQMEQMLESRYRSALHIDNNMVLRTFKGSRDFEEFPLSGSDSSWSLEIMNILGDKKLNG